MRAVLRYHEKYQFKKKYVVEVSLYEVSEDVRYPTGIKYGLICIDTKSGRKVLMDNHHPKQDHFHLDDEEFEYEFVSVEQLLIDFKKLILSHLGVKI